MTAPDLKVPYAEVIGTPIAHSKSPLIHGFWLEKLGIPAHYRACHVLPSELVSYLAVRRIDPAWRGCNITIPHKESAVLLVDVLDARAAAVGAINTIVRQRDGTLLGTNTDVDGILEALPEQLMPRGSEVCIIGAGGAARAALFACKQRGVSLIMLSARRVDQGRALLEEFQPLPAYHVAPIEERGHVETAEVIINATPLGMTGQPDMPVQVLEGLSGSTPGAVVFDMVYKPLETALLRKASEAGCTTVDGLTMLIGQAATAFEHFFGRSPSREHDAELRALLTA